MASDAYNAGVSNVQGANSTGQNAIGAFDPNAWQKTTQSGLDKLSSDQAAGNQSIVDAFKTQIASQPSATDYYNQGMDAFNVRPLQEQANTLGNMMLNTPNNNLNAARGFNFDQNQIDQKNSQDLQRLAPAAQAAQNNATTAQGNAIAYQNAGLQQNAMNLVPITAEQQMQTDLYARQFSGFTQTAQAQLASLQAKMQSGVQLSTQEMQSYAELTKSEQSYQASMASVQASIQVAQLNNQFQTVAQNSNILNTKTGSLLNPTIANPNGMRQLA